MEPIKKQINMGAGISSYAIMGYLNHRLHHAFEILGGIQQCLMSTDSLESHKEHDKAIDLGQSEVDDIAKEIYLALTGYKLSSRKTYGENING